MSSDTPRTDALVRFEFESTGQPFPAHALLAMIQLSRQLERELSAVTAERDALRSSDDGNGPAWCATCGGLMQAVRPGKHQCVACEHYDHLRTKLHDAEAERDAMLNLLDSPDLIEELSALEHERWAGWMQYQDTAPEAKRADWPRKASLPYSALTDQEKESDRIEVRKTLSLIRAAIAAGKEGK